MLNTIRVLLSIIIVTLAFGMGSSYAKGKKSGKKTHKKAPATLKLDQKDQDVSFHILSNEIVIKKQPVPRGEDSFRGDRLPPETVMGVFTFKL